MKTILYCNESACTKFSLLAGSGADSAGGYLEGMGMVYANLVLASQAKICLIEEVLPYFSSRSYYQLKTMLKSEFPYWTERITGSGLDAYSFGSPAGRRCGYVVASRTLAQQGDTEAVRRADRVAKVRMTGDPHMADDVVQDALIRVFLHLGSLADTSRFIPWFHRIVRKRWRILKTENF